MQINATQIRVGMVLVIDNELYRVTWTMHRTPGKGNACMQTKLKNIVSGRNLEKRFLSSERAEKASLDSRSMQYLFKDSSGYVFMDNENFDQIPISEDVIGDAEKFLNEKIGSIIKELGENKNPDTRKIILIDVPQALSSQSYSRDSRVVS